MGAVQDHEKLSTDFAFQTAIHVKKLLLKFSVWCDRKVHGKGRHINNCMKGRVEGVDYRASWIHVYKLFVVYIYVFLLTLDLLERCEGAVLSRLLNTRLLGIPTGVSSQTLRTFSLLASVLIVCCVCACIKSFER